MLNWLLGKNRYAFRCPLCESHLSVSLSVRTKKMPYTPNTYLMLLTEHTCTECETLLAIVKNASGEIGCRDIVKDTKLAKLGQHSDDLLDEIGRLQEVIEDNPADDEKIAHAENELSTLYEAFMVMEKSAINRTYRYDDQDHKKPKVQSEEPKMNTWR